jgi:putative ABC transport system ATP-binding protein
MSFAVACRGVSKSYGEGALAETALAHVSLNFSRGEASVLLGPSGSGKTTLLSILGCLLTPTEGELEIDGQVVPRGARDQRLELRRRKIGFVFQHGQLLGFLTVEQNLRLVADNAGLKPAEAIDRIGQLTARLDIAELRRRKPAQLSGGQRQRVAIARALIHCPSIVLADEPTAALDWANGQVVIRLLIEQARQTNAALIVVTHDTRLIDLFDRVLHLDSGRMQAS